MDLTALDTAPELDELMKQARQYGVEPYLLDLVMYGFTVIPAEKLGADHLTDKLRTAILDVYTQQTGHTIDDWRSFNGELKDFNPWGWILEDEAFIEALHNPVFQLVGHFLTGNSGFVAGSAALLQSQQHRCDIPLQRDSLGVPGETYTLCANLSWLLTDNLSLADGPTMLVKNQSGRPSGNDDQPIPLLGAAGSLAVWNGTIWHESNIRTQPGLQMSLIHSWQRVFMRRLEPAQEIPTELLERWPSLAKILGQERMYPSGKTLSPHTAQTVGAGRDQYA